MKEMFDEKLPKYYLVKKAIVENIDNEVYDSKEPIPSERDLSGQQNYDPESD